MHSFCLSMHYLLKHIFDLRRLGSAMSVLLAVLLAAGDWQQGLCKREVYVHQML